MADEIIVITASRFRMAVAVLASAVLGAAGAMAALAGRPLGWFVFTFFALCAFASLWLLVLKLPKLTLSSQGFFMSTAFGPAGFFWSDVTGFEIIRVFGAKMVGIRFSASCAKLRRARSFVGRVTGVSGAIGNHYSKSPEEICALLNEWRCRYGAVQPDLAA